MRLDEPGWWYDERAQIVPRVLAPLSLLYGLVVERRLRQEPAYRSRLPVICIGNFTVGGSGKTPFTAHVCKWFADHGRRPAIVTRGYGGSVGGPAWVGETDDAGKVGDEALLLARVAPTVVSRDRGKGALLIEADPRGFDVIVMDDGFQNRSLAKSLSLVLVSASRGLGNGRVLPGGPLRAPLDAQIADAGAIVIVDGAPPSVPEQRARLASGFAAFSGPPILEAKVEPAATGDLKGKPVVAYCGIAGPERFFATVEALGAQILVRRAFRDHHPLSEAEVGELIATARDADATLVTTEKDLARLTGGSGARAALRAASVAIPIRVVLEPGDEERLGRLLAQAAGLS